MAVKCDRCGFSEVESHLALKVDGVTRCFFCIGEILRGHDRMTVDLEILRSRIAEADGLAAAYAEELARANEKLRGFAQETLVGLLSCGAETEVERCDND